MRGNGITIVIGDNVKSIPAYLFGECFLLTNIIIPDSVTSIGEGAFVECYELKNIYYHGTEEQWEAILVGDNNDTLSSATIYYYSESDPFEGEGAVTDGNYWHYANDGVTVVVWTKETV